MSLKKPDELREMQPEERDVRLKELRSELMNERGVASMGGQPTSPGRMRAEDTNRFLKALRIPKIKIGRAHV